MTTGSPSEAAMGRSVSDRNVARKGLFRTVLAGPGGTLQDAFGSLERASCGQQVWRNPADDALRVRVSVPVSEGAGYWDFTRIRNDVYVIVENFAYAESRTELVPGDGLVQFNFRLAGDLTLDGGARGPFRLHRPSLTIWNQEPGCDVSEWTAAGAHERNVAICVRPEYLSARFLAALPNVPPQLQPFVSRGEGRRVNFFQLPLSAQMFDLASCVLNDSGGALAAIRIEALATQLLCCAVERLSFPSLGSERVYSERELRRLHAAREYLTRQLAPAPSVREVARNVGMSETALKREFSACFGETPFELSVRHRMQCALKLLRDERMPVAIVAERVGYRHHTSFASAFLRHFGFRPKDARRA